MSQGANRIIKREWRGGCGKSLKWDFTALFEAFFFLRKIILSPAHYNKKFKFERTHVLGKDYVL